MSVAHDVLSVSLRTVMTHAAESFVGVVSCRRRGEATRLPSIHPMVEQNALSRLKHHENSHLDAPPGRTGFFTREGLLFHSVNCLL